MDNKLKLYFKEEFNKKLKESKTYNIINLSQEEKDILTEKISNLPYNEKVILYMKYIFDEKESNIGLILDLENPEKDIFFLENLLASELGYENKNLDPKELKEAVDIVYNRELEEDNIEELSHIYGEKFMEIMRSIGLERSGYRKSYRFFKKVALFFLLVSLSFSVFLGTNTSAREALVGWIINTYPEYSEFKRDNSLTNQTKMIKHNIIINYIPDYFNLVESEHFPNAIFYHYESEDNKTIDIEIFLDDSVSTQLNTENSELELFEFNNNAAYYWLKDDISFMIFYVEGYQTTIIGNISKNEIIKIADNIKIN